MADGGRRYVVRCRVGTLLQERNAARVAAGQAPVSVRELARATGIAYSGLRKLVDGDTRRVDFSTLERLLASFETGELSDLLEVVVMVD